MHFETRNSKKDASKSSKKCIFEILNPKPLNVLKSDLKMRKYQKVLQKVVKNALLKS